ncbi:MAG: hypothetical protein NTW29_04630 [Bacteroidetes bacterium]|nr:hypothetical protein [Bacteroidota bacterium]
MADFSGSGWHSGDESDRQQDDRIDWFEGRLLDKDDVKVKSAYEDQLQKAIREKDDWYFNELILLYNKFHPAGIFSYLPWISHFVFCKEPAGDHFEDKVQLQLAILYFTIDKHNWEIRQYLLQQLHYSPDERVRDQIRSAVPSLLAEDAGNIPIPTHFNKVHHKFVLIPRKEFTEKIEWVRGTYDPEQTKKWPVHLSLCLDHEVDHSDQIARNLSFLYLLPVTLKFISPVSFANDYGIHIPLENDQEAFHTLRTKILKGISDEPVPFNTSITLIDPRSGIHVADIYPEIRKMDFPSTIIFDACNQYRTRGNEAWELVNQFFFTK